jgi:CheY-like chemotaxis protein
MTMKKLLLIDDEEPIRRLLTSVLEMGDFHVTAAASAAEGIRFLGAEVFDVVLTDLRMESPLAGYDVVKAARGLARHPLTVIMTAFPVPASDWKRVGADALLTKGGETLGLTDRLEGLLAARASISSSFPLSQQALK